MARKMIRVRLANASLRFMRHDKPALITGEQSVPDIAYYRRAIRRGELEIVEDKPAPKKAKAATKEEK